MIGREILEGQTKKQKQIELDEEIEEDDELEEEDIRDLENQSDKPSIDLKFRRKLKYADSDDGFDEYDFTHDEPEFDESQSITTIGPALGALKKYFWDRLRQVIEFLGGSEEILQSWKVYVTVHSSGLSLGLIDVFYLGPRLKRSSNRVEVAIYLGLLPSARSLKNMSREQLYLIAMETREKHLISQLLGVTGGLCDSVQFMNDVLTIVFSQPSQSSSCTSSSDLPPIVQQNLILQSDSDPHTQVMMISSSPLVKCDGSAPPSPSSQLKTIYFSFGNITVLDWGQISQEPSFHSPTQIFPIGFRCLRQENDVLLDRVVDCLCEVMVSREVGPGGGLVSVPIFRLTVGWVVDDPQSPKDHPRAQRVLVRVYEARSAQQVWQAAMLETAGLPSASLAEPLEDPNTAMEEMDAEEVLLRKEIRELRRAYFRALRVEQSLGLQAAVRPRLLLDSVDSFADEGVMRLIEGMSGAILCQNYQFIDSREPPLETGASLGERVSRSHPLARGFQRMHLKGRALKKVLGRDSDPHAAETFEGRDQDEAIAKDIKRRQRPPSDSRKRTKLESKEGRVFVQALQKVRLRSIRKIETQISSLKNSLSKTLKKRREEARQKVEQLYHLEEIRMGSQLPALLGERHLISCLPFLPIGQVPRPPHPLSLLSIPSPCLQTPPLHLGSPLDGSLFGPVIEVWDFLRSFSSALSLPQHIPASHYLPYHKELNSLLSTDLSFEKFLSYFRSLAPFTRTLLSLSPHISMTPECRDYPVECSSARGTFLLPSEENSALALSAAALSLSAPLLKEYEKLMGMEADPSSPCRVPLNGLTWREVARVCLVAQLCKELGMGDTDVSLTIRGRGHLQAPDATEKKLLKLIRRRAISSFLSRSECSEAVGFGSGLCLRLPVPRPRAQPSLPWNELLLWGVRSVPRLRGSDFSHLLRSAVTLIRNGPAGIDPENDLRRALISIASPPFLCPMDCSISKLATLYIIHRSLPSYFSHCYPSLTSPPLPQISISIFSAPQSFDFSFLTYYEPFLTEEFQPPALIPTGVEFFLLQPPTLLSSVSCLPPLPAPTIEATSSQLTEDFSAETLRVQAKGETAEQPSEASDLPVSMQRCLHVLGELSAHPLASYFCLPVDPENVPLYYSSVTQPISLSDIRAAVISGKYMTTEGTDPPTPLLDFYSDVILLLDNALSFNSETSPIHVAAMKIGIIFERLFLEIPLNLDSPLPFKEACLICRRSSPINSSQMNLKYATCDRCEGCVHLNCTDPPLSSHPRSEWFCPSCTDLYGPGSAAATLHPNRSARVMHPTSTFEPTTASQTSNPNSHTLHPLVGTVIGAEQARHGLLFVVSFEGGGTQSRELWNGEKVRKYSLKEEESCPPLPSGYFYHDLDKVFGKIRGYGGWGGGLSIIPPFLSSMHSIPAAKRSLHDPHFSSSCLAASLLSGGWGWGGNGWGVGLPFEREFVSCLDFHADEWAVILKSLALRVASTPTIQLSLSKMDESRERLLRTCLQRIRWGSANWKTILSTSDQHPDPIVPSFIPSLNTNASAGTSLGREEWEWDRRRQSRRRGREDALLSLLLASSVASDVDLDGLKEDEELGTAADIDIKKELGPFFPAVLGTVVRQCIVWPGEQHQIKEWAKGWTTKMKQSNTTRSSSKEGSGSPLCAYCGSDEAYIGSQLVKGQSWKQWEEEIAKDTQRIRILCQPTQKSPDLIQLPPWSHLASATLSSADGGSVASKVEVSVGVGVGVSLGIGSGTLTIPSVPGASGGVRRGNGLDQQDRSWRPHFQPDLEEEEKAVKQRLTQLAAPYLRNLPESNEREGSPERLNSDLSFHSPCGDVIVHELCAEGMNLYRQALLAKSLRNVELRVAEALVGQARGRPRPLGRDSLGHSYWVLSGSPIVLVHCSDSQAPGTEISACSSEAADLKRFGEKIFKNKWAVQDENDAEDEGEDQLGCGEEAKDEVGLASLRGRVAVNSTLGAKGGTWWVFHSDQDIATLIRWLSPSSSSPSPTLSTPQSIVTSLFYSPSPPLPPPQLLFSEDIRLCACLCLLFPSALALAFQGPIPSCVSYPFFEVQSGSDKCLERSTDLEGKGVSDEEQRETPEGHRWKEGDRVLVHLEAGARVPSLEGVVVKVLVRRGGYGLHALEGGADYFEEKPGDRYFYLVSLEGCGSVQEAWYPSHLLRSASVGIGSRQLRGEKETFAVQACSPPPLLSTLISSQYLEAPDRASSHQSSFCSAPWNFSSCQLSSPLDCLRSALLILEAALPLGSLDESEDKWCAASLPPQTQGLEMWISEDSNEAEVPFSVIWREAVLSSPDPASLMQCELLLESCIRPSWIRPQGSKLLCSLPSRSYCLRNTSVGLLAIKIWTLDQVIMFDKIGEGGNTGKNRSSKTKSSTGKKKK